MTTTTPKSNDAALAAFMAGKAEIDALLARRQRRPFRHQPRARDLGRRRQPRVRYRALEGDYGVPPGLNGTHSYDGPDRVLPGGAPGHRRAVVALPTQETRS